LSTAAWSGPGTGAPVVRMGRNPGRTGNECGAGVHNDDIPGNTGERVDNLKEYFVKLMTFAAGLAAGYVLGARAGREKYEQITAAFDRARSHPAVSQARDAASDLVTTATEAPTPTPTPTPAAAPTPTPTPSLSPVDSPGIASPGGASRRPRRAGTQATVTAPSVTADPAPEV
jgi:hypothetical protein